jgi:hypothetical protein
MLLAPASVRLAPDVVRRPRLERWLATHARFPIRTIVAPAGMGKTTLLAQHLHVVEGAAAYCALPPGCSPDDFLTAASHAIGLPKRPGSFIDFLVALRQMASQRPFELAIDDADNAAPPTLELLLKLVENVPEGISLIYAARSREPVAASRWVAAGTGALCDARRLAFDRDEIALFADASGVAHSQSDISQLLEATDGWAIVVSGAMRAAVEDQRSLHDAYEHWRSAYGELFIEFLTAGAERASDEDRAAVMSFVNGTSIDDQNVLRRLEAKGLFVITDGKVRPLRAVQQARAVPTQGVDTSVPMVVRMLGRFSAAIAGRSVDWVRRRDQQVVKYLLLRPGGTATRHELATLFWPGTNRNLALQSVRTACSNIRRAIAGVVGYARVERYFRAADNTVIIDLSNVVTDVGRFTAYTMAGDAAYERGELPDASTHYGAAEKIYAGRLLEDDPSEPWFRTQAKALEDRFALVLSRLAESCYHGGDLKHAAEYAYRAKLIAPDQPRLAGLLTALKQPPKPA